MPAPCRPWRRDQPRVVVGNLRQRRYRSDGRPAGPITSGTYRSAGEDAPGPNDDEGTREDDQVVDELTCRTRGSVLRRPLPRSSALSASARLSCQSRPPRLDAARRAGVRAGIALVSDGATARVCLVGAAAVLLDRAPR